MFRLKAFGGLSLESDEARLPTSAHQRRRLTLLAILARAGDRGLTRDRLHALLWPEGTEESARHALDQLLYATRRDLGKQVISSEGGQLRLDAEIVSSDVAEFEAHLQRREWEAAVGLYTGPFLDGVHLGDSVTLEQWADAERRRLGEQYVSALDRMARQAAAEGDPQAVVAWRRRQVAAEPLSGQGAIGLLEALVAAGDRAGAIRYSQTYAALLREELGTEPDAEFKARVERITRTPGPTPSAAPLAPEPSAGEPLLDSAESPVPAEASPTPPAEAEATPAPRAPARETLRPVPGFKALAVVGVAVLCVVLGWWVLWGNAGVEGAPAIGSVEAAAHSPAAAPDRTVAVLPFVDMSPGRDHEYLADGITEELINALSKLPGLNVVARTSAFTFKGQNADVREIGSKVGARTVLGGSVRRSGDRLRISVQLMDAQNGYQLWAETYDRKMDDVFAIQEEISRAVVRTLHPTLLRNSPAPLVPASTENPAAYQLYMQGRYFWNQRTEQGLRQSIERFEEAVRLDPGYALAYSGLSDAHNALTDNGYVPSEPALEKAEVAVLTALKLDPRLAEAHSSLGHLKLHRWDWAGAEQDFRRSIDLNPGYAVAHQYYAFLLTFQGRFDEAIPLIRRAQHLDPLSPAIQRNLGQILYLTRRYPEAAAQLRSALQMDSANVSARQILANTLVEMGRYDEAVVELQRVIATSGGWHRSAVAELGYAYARAGRPAEAERVRREIELARREGRSLSLYAYAVFLGALGRHDEAFARLDSAYESQRSGLVVVGVDPVMDPLRSDPRYPRFLRRLGLTVGP